MRKTWVQIDGVLYEKGTEPRPVSPMVMGDIDPYQSMIDGSVIESRSEHREHLHRHGYQEVGDDSSLMKQHTGIPDVSPQKRKELIRSQIASLTDKQFREMHKRAVDNWKWNSNER
mgnify:CR=1 FL=1